MKTQISDQSSTENMYLLINGLKELNCMGFYIPAIYVLI